MASQLTGQRKAKALRNAALIGLAGALLFALSPAARAQIYSAEELTRRASLGGQDGWQLVGGFGGISVDQGSGINPSTVLQGPSSFSSFAARTNDSNFSFAQFTGLETSVVLQIDVYPVFTPMALFGLGHDSITDTDSVINQASETGPLFGTMTSNGARLVIQEAGRGTSHLSSITLANLSWYQIRLEMDFTANAGQGSGSLFLRNLSLGETSFTAVPDLQNISLGLTNTAADVRPFTYDGMFIGMGFGHMDNIGVVPEPATSALLVGATLFCAVLRIAVKRRAERDGRKAVPRV
ncbi:MAG: hypothetical protein AVDCRST_MAG42-1075 [uncultured Chthoniobacterales bacterium]|uniref:PEP-CTERM protein-sorting domain-containing protein n=1 Tax=uncultured Chthoniobacterales bacterium TaxID=1836801 RepID=A0A6J4HQD0_9BACT|nr:MAG: hypothetical protein AVDCRST_MAG42-1075 [uncultured Chthoniobacterales bacterium]